MILLVTTPGQERPENVGHTYKKRLFGGLKKPLVRGILGVTKPTKYIIH